MKFIAFNIEYFLDKYAQKKIKTKKDYNEKYLNKAVSKEGQTILKNLLMLNKAMNKIFIANKNQLLLKAKIINKENLKEDRITEDVWVDFFHHYKSLMEKERDSIAENLTNPSSDDEYIKNKGYLNQLNKLLDIDINKLREMAKNEVFRDYNENFNALVNILNCFRHAKRIEQVKNLMYKVDYTSKLENYKENAYELLEELENVKLDDPNYGEIRRLLESNKKNTLKLKSPYFRGKRLPSILKYSKVLDNVYLQRLVYVENSVLECYNKIVKSAYPLETAELPGEYGNFKFVRENLPRYMSANPKDCKTVELIFTNLNCCFKNYEINSKYRIVKTMKQNTMYAYYINAIYFVNELDKLAFKRPKDKYTSSCYDLSYFDSNKIVLDDLKNNTLSKKDRYLIDLREEIIAKNELEEKQEREKKNNIILEQNKKEILSNAKRSENNTQSQTLPQVDKNLPLDKQIDEYFRGLIGLNDVKNALLEVIAKKVLEGKNYEQGQMHMAFLGNPGTGKTTVARIVGKILHENGLIDSDKVVECKFSDLYKRYVGFSAKATEDKIKEAEGGVLFIDEAHQLAVNNAESDFRKEIINVLVPALENNKNLLVIFAGYSNEMLKMLKGSDKGLFSRVNHRINFKDFNKEDIMKLFELQLSKKKNRNDEKFIITKDALKLLSKYFDLLILARKDNFANGREVRTTVNKMLNCFAVLTLKRSDIRTIDSTTMSKILTSNSFKEEILMSNEDAKMQNQWNDFVNYVNNYNSKKENIKEEENVK